MYTIMVKNQAGSEVVKYVTGSLREVVSLGKSPDNPIVVNDPSISEKHCAFEFDGKNISIRNLKSRNGVILNGERIKTEKAEATEADEIRIGDFMISFLWEGSTEDLLQAKKKSRATLLTWVVSFLLLALLGWIIRPLPEKEILIPPLTPLEETKSGNETPGQITWQILLSKAKDAYFNDSILEAAKLFKQVLELQPQNMVAANFLEQIRKEMVPKMEDAIKTNISERNIVTCSSTVEELKILDPTNAWIEKAQGLLEGYKKFDEVRKLYEAHCFRDAQKKIQNVVLVDEETLEEWVSKVDHEVSVTENFREILTRYRSGPISQSYKELKPFLDTETIQKDLLSLARQKLQLVKRFAGFKELQKQDPLKQTSFGVALLYDLSEKEDPFIYYQVNQRLEELTTQCGPGTEFYILLNEDTGTQLEQARDYKKIHEYKQSLSNYRSALNGLRILSFFSKEPEFIKQEGDVYQEILSYQAFLKNRIEELHQINESDFAGQLSDILERYRVYPNKTVMAATEDLYQGEGDDKALIREIFNTKVSLPSQTAGVTKTEKQADSFNKSGNSNIVKPTLTVPAENLSATRQEET